MTKLIIFNKPYGVLSQFTDSSNRSTLGQFVRLKNFYPCGRLDKDSEGLLLLTDDGKIQHRISSPEHKLKKYYWVQVEGEVKDSALNPLREGILLNDGPCKPALASLMAPPKIWPRNPPIRERKSIPTTWLQIVISEGRNRQIRRMTAAIKHPTLRLIRHRIGDWHLDNLPPGKYTIISI